MMHASSDPATTVRRSVLITGCSSGIGADAARSLHARGWTVFATCRKAEDCEALNKEGLESFVLDYADPDSISAAVDRTLERTGGTLDALINNGAYGLPGAVEDLPRDGLREIFEVNLFGWHDLTCRVIPTMRAQGHGRILMISSVLGFVPFKWRGAYVATKYALEGLTDTLRLELRDTPLSVVLVQPGPISTKIRINSRVHFERWIDWENSARADQYRDVVLNRLYGDVDPAPFELLPDAVTRRIIQALEAERPRLRYRVTVPTRAMALARRLLPDRAMDWLADRG